MEILRFLACPLAPKLPVRIWKHDKSNLGTRRTQKTKTQYFATPGPTAHENWKLVVFLKHHAMNVALLYFLDGAY